MLMVGDILSWFTLGEETDPQSDAFSQWLMKRTYEEQRLRGGRFAFGLGVVWYAVVTSVALGAMFAALPT